ncbi:YggT family protein [Orbaceae bacterium ESL0721]|nr:YggT family protein [Orbaceae bacterium ESL0721]
MTSLFFLGKTLLTICLYIVILRLWMQMVRVNFYNPFTQFIIRITQPIIGPLRHIIPSVGRFDSATWTVLYIIALIKVIFIFNFVTNASFWNLSYLWIAFLAILQAVGTLLFWLLLFRAILSWVMALNQRPSYADDLLAQLTEPLIAPIRRIIPPIGMIDISFMIVVFILFFLNMFAKDLFGLVWILL